MFQGLSHNISIDARSFPIFTKVFRLLARYFEFYRGVPDFYRGIPMSTMLSLIFSSGCFKFCFTQTFWIISWLCFVDHSTCDIYTWRPISTILSRFMPICTICSDLFRCLSNVCQYIPINSDVHHSVSVFLSNSLNSTVRKKLSTTSQTQLVFLRLSASAVSSNNTWSQWEEQTVGL